MPVVGGSFRGWRAVGLTAGAACAAAAALAGTRSRDQPPVSKPPLLLPQRERRAPTPMPAPLAAAAATATATERGGAAATAHPSVPILMYHVIADPPPGAAFPELWVSPRDFAGQMHWLASRGFTAVTLLAVWEHWHHQVALPSRPIVITFDDGYLSVPLRALPVLDELGWPGVLNLKVANLTGEGSLGEGPVRRLLAAGWELAAHTITHPDLPRLGDAALAREVEGSRADLRRRFGVPVDFFCYPAGRFDERVITAVRHAGYLGATTTEYGLGRNDEPFTLDRVRVGRSDGLTGFAAKLEALSSRP